MWQKYVTCDVDIAQCEDNTIKCEKKIRKLLNVTNTVTCEIGTTQCKNEIIKCEKQIRELLNLTKELSNVMLKLYNVRIEPSNVRKK